MYMYFVNHKNGGALRSHTFPGDTFIMNAMQDKGYERVDYADYVKFRKEHRHENIDRRYVVVKARDYGMDPTGGEWVCFCTKHSTLCNFQTRAEARMFRPGGEWCEACMAEQEPYPSFKALHGREPIAGADFDPDKGMCQDDYEYFTGTGRYTNTPTHNVLHALAN
jgi:hypothetical protein